MGLGLDSVAALAGPWQWHEKERDPKTSHITSSNNNGCHYVHFICMLVDNI